MKRTSATVGGRHARAARARVTRAARLNKELRELHDRLAALEKRIAADSARLDAVAARVAEELVRGRAARGAIAL